jgi:SNF2 family DNA or RNA helicase
MPLELLPYQEEAVEWCMEHEKICAILAYDMGLGKTVITCALLSRKHMKTLVVAPSCVLHQWSAELSKHTEIQNIVIYHGANRKHARKKLAEANVIITTSHVLANDIANKDDSAINMFLSSVQRWVIDEAHQLRNNKNKVYKFLYSYAHQVPNKVFLTGTPVCNSPTDIISLVCLSNNTEYNDLKMWKNMRYVKRMTLLKEITKSSLLRKTKEETIASILPSFAVKNISMNMAAVGEQKRVYDDAIIDDIVLRRILRMRQALNNHARLREEESYETAIKILAVEELVAEIPVDDKIIIFSYFTTMLKDLREYIVVPDGIERDAYIQVYHGELSTSDRNKVLAKFRNTSDARILLINLRAGGCGLNLTEANHVILMEPYWNESEQQQALNRVYRLGQTKDVHIYRLQIKNSIESWLVSLQNVKANISKLLIDKENLSIVDIIQQKQDVNRLFQDLAVKPGAKQDNDDV